MQVTEVMLQSDIFVFDHGVHYNERERNLFADTMASILLTASSHAEIRSKLKVFAWRQTTAQHFNSTGGHYVTGIQEKGCQPMYSGFEGFRTQAIRNQLEQKTNLTWTEIRKTEHEISSWMDASSYSSPTELIMLPFRDYTRHLHDLHPSRGDCTHYCHTPYLWLPVWRSLRLAVDRAVKKEENREQQYQQV